MILLLTMRYMTLFWAQFYTLFFFSSFERTHSPAHVLNHWRRKAHISNSHIETWYTPYGWTYWCFCINLLRSRINTNQHCISEPMKISPFDWKKTLFDFKLKRKAIHSIDMRKCNMSLRINVYFRVRNLLVILLVVDTKFGFCFAIVWVCVSVFMSVC